MKTPYDVFESIYGKYDPEHPHAIPFSIWMREEKAEYLRQHPEAVKNQIDGNFYEAELTRFFTWVIERQR
jgi:beta-glucanase (GH16 family)